MVQERELAVNVPDSATAAEGEPIQTGDDVGMSQDTIVSEPEYAILLTPPEKTESISRDEGSNDGVSIIMGAIFLLFLIIALRFRNNIKYAVSISRHIIETRARQNFDDTVRETSLILMLNILWIACAGIIGFYSIMYYHPEISQADNQVGGILGGMAIACCYTVFMWIAYSVVGYVFSDQSHARLWVKGFSASQALMSPAFFIIALLIMCSPVTTPVALFLGITVFLLAKLIFIWRGFKIFFNQFSSWMLFLCYLCSLEIVPLILCYRCAFLLD